MRYTAARAQTRKLFWRQLVDRPRPWIELDVGRFDPRRIQAVKHRLEGHPLLELPALSRFAERMSPLGQLRFHGNTTTAATAFNTAPTEHATGLTAVETVQSIERAGSWVSFLNIQTDPEYRALVDEVLDGLKPELERVDPGMYGYAGWIFLTSPRVVTPFHMDRENNFILQVRGDKRIHVWDPNDHAVVTPRIREDFNTYRSRDKQVYKDEFLPRAQIFDAKPGDGAFMPSNGPHWVRNGDNVSVTVSFTYYTRATKRFETLCRANSALRRLGLRPPAAGSSQLRDTVKQRAYTAFLLAKGLLGKTSGELPFGQRYAPHES